MASYVVSNLTSKETIIHQCKISKWWSSPFIFAAFIGLPLLAIEPWVAALLFLGSLNGLIYYLSTELAVTSKRVIAKSGFISRKTVEINIGKLESITVKQGILGRIFNFGNVGGSGTGGAIAPIKGIYNPLAFRKAALEASESVT